MPYYKVQELKLVRKATGKKESFPPEMFSIMHIADMDLKVMLFKAGLLIKHMGCFIIADGRGTQKAGTGSCSRPKRATVHARK